MPTSINHELTITDLLQLLNEKVASVEHVHDTTNHQPSNTNNKRIGLMQIDPKVYELLDNPCMELFE